MQEVVSLPVFMGVCRVMFASERQKWNHLLSFAFLMPQFIWYFTKNKGATECALIQ
jgi:uncharacterized protein (DUF486 family)